MTAWEGMLSTIRVGLTTISKKLPDPPTIEQSKQMLDETLTTVRRISLELTPSTLEKFGLIPVLREICDRFQATALTPINFLEYGEIRVIEAKRALKIFRIVQELVNNAIKHAQASNINVSVSGRRTIENYRRG